jgi:dUTP pyrophosphatase
LVVVLELVPLSNPPFRMSLADTERPVIIFEQLFPDVELPVRSTEGAAGYDVRAYLRGRRIRLAHDQRTYERTLNPEQNSLLLAPGERALIPLGFRARLPKDVEAQVRLRSSAAFFKGLILPNAPGTIDPDYPEEWLVLVSNTTQVVVPIEHGERFAQIILSRFVVAEWISGGVTPITNRMGGIGSTDTFHAIRE